MPVPNTGFFCSTTGRVDTDPEPIIPMPTGGFMRLTVRMRIVATMGLAIIAAVAVGASGLLGVRSKFAQQVGGAIEIRGLGRAFAEERQQHHLNT